MASLTVQKNHAGCRDRQRQPKKRADQQDAGEHGKFERIGHIDGQQQQQNPARDVDGHEGVNGPGRQWHDHERDDGHDASHQGDVGVPREPATTAVGTRGRPEIASQIHSESFPVKAWPACLALTPRSSAYSASTLRT